MKLPKTRIGRAVLLAVTLGILMILPAACGRRSDTPKKPVPSGETSICFTGDLPDGVRLQAEQKAAAYGLEIKEGGPAVNIIRTGSETDNAYTVSWSDDRRCTVSAGSDDSIFYACKDAILAVYYGKYDDIASPEPAVPLRGVIEGFYGDPWSHEFRVSLMDFLGEENMNTYIYAPKDDAKHRNQWRVGYTEEELGKLTELVRAAENNRVAFVYALSPGNDIALSGSGYERDFAKLMEKMQSMYDIGVRSFAIFLDDILVKDAAGHARLLNDFQAQFVKTHEGCADLLCISPEYTDPFYTSDYTDAFAAALDPEIAVMWTGPGVVPASITAADLKKINDIYQRKMYIWWNYPVNDTMRDRLFLDACQGLSADLTDVISGFVANPMNEGEASKIPLATLSDYLIDPQYYDADASLKASAARFAEYDDTLTEALLELASHTSAGAINGQKESEAAKKLINAWNADKTPGGSADKALREYFKQTEAYAEALLSIDNAQFLSETHGWIGKMQDFGKMGLAYLEAREVYEKLQNAGGSDAALQEQLAALLKTYDEAKSRADGNNKVVSASGISLFFYGAGDEIDRMTGRGIKGKLLEGRMTSSLPVYDSHELKYATDNDLSTFYWSAGEFGKGSYIRLDLGEVCDITAIEILCGAPGHENDYIHAAELQISDDGKEWSSAGSFSEAEIRLSDLALRGRYIRLVATESQIYWVTVMEFRAYAPAS